MSSNKFDLESGALSLDFANTADWHASDHPVERLNCYDDLIRWGEAAGILASDQAEKLRQIAASRPEGAKLVFVGAIRLREAIYRLFSGFSETGSFEAEDLAILNEALKNGLPHLNLVPASGGFAWEWTESPDSLDRVLWPVARSAGDLLASDSLDRVRQCADDRGCGYLFIDTSRNGSRRWCSMESCGNRAKARRFQRRQKDDQQQKVNHESL